MAVVTVSGNPVVGTKYTVTTANSADWASVSNSTYFYDLTDKLVYYKDSSGTILSVFSSAGGLTYFTEARSTTAPNTATNVDSLSAGTGLSTTDVDIAIVPRANGAFLLDIPDSSISGGNKRGTNAIDLQIVRASATQVASGNYSVAIGYGNTASNSHATAIGRENIANAIGSTSLGYTNTSSGSYSFSVGLSNVSSGNYSFTAGQTNTASGTYSFCGGGQNNTASGQYAIAMGYSCSATSTNSVAIGRFCTSSNTSVAIGYNTISSGTGGLATGQSSKDFGVQGRHSHSATTLSGNGGDAQKSVFVLSRRTTDNTLTFLTADGLGFANSSVFVSLQDNNVFRFKGSIVGKQSASTNVGVWDIDGVIVRGTSVGTTALVIGNVNVVTNSSSWGTPTLTADTTNGALRVNVTGAVGINIQWTALIETTEVIYA